MPKLTRKLSSSHVIYLRTTLSVGLVAAVAYLLSSHWASVSQGLQLARGASIGWLVLSVIVSAVTFCVAAAIYRTLALKNIAYFRTLLVEVASAFVNRLLPAGIGGLGLHGDYLYKQKHSISEATAIVSVNNIMGMVAHVLLLGLALAFYPQTLGQFAAWNNMHVSFGVYVVVGFVTAAILSVPWVRTRLWSLLRNIGVSLHRLRVNRLLEAFVLALLLTTTYTLALLCAARSVDIQLGVIQVFIVFSVGMLTSTVTPTPGGLVGAEAGLFAGFIGFGVPDAAAGVAVLMYRLATYWLPLVPGALALLVARKRRFI